MKSFVAYPLEFGASLFPQKNVKATAGKLIAHYELYKKVSHLNGAIVKCGITVDEGFTRFAKIKEMTALNKQQKLVAFEKYHPTFEEVVAHDGEVTLKVNGRVNSSFCDTNEALVQKGIDENIEFVPGLISEVLPEYIIKNPELKIAMLNIDLDEYESTLTTLEFLYPRLMPGGILILDNFYKYLGEQKAVKDYFSFYQVTVNNFSVNNGPHYIAKP